MKLREHACLMLLFAVSGGYSFRNVHIDHHNVPYIRSRSQLGTRAQPWMETEAQLISRLNEEITANTGVPLDQLINPAKVVNLERELVLLNLELALTENENENENERLTLQTKINSKTQLLNREKLSVMRNWMKNLFVGQSVLAAVLSLLMVCDKVPGYHVPLPVQVLGFWMWWLFIIPSLRARKPQAVEKEALNIAFLASPIVSILAPAVFTKDVVVLWGLNALVVLLSYVYAYTTYSANIVCTTNTTYVDGNAAVDSVESSTSDMRENVVPKWLRSALRAMDYGSGQERGLRK